ncbi:MAG: YrhK family protein [Elainellaceae cyanobacterium]
MHLRSQLKLSRHLSLILGLLGNAAFFLGSVLFLWESLTQLGVWLFIVGSLCMLIGSIRSIMARL